MMTLDKSLAMVEYSSVSAGMAAADHIAKTIDLQFIRLKTVCPGKFIVLFSGELSALKSAVDTITTQRPDKLMDSFVLGNPHPSIFDVLETRIEIQQPSALGIIETATSAAAIKAADIAAKAARIRLLELRLAKSMCGKAYVLFSGALASVEESADCVLRALDAPDVIIDFSVISAPDTGFINALSFD